LQSISAKAFENSDSILDKKCLSNTAVSLFSDRNAPTITPGMGFRKWNPAFFFFETTTVWNA
jgi:hypothetical protein